MNHEIGEGGVVFTTEYLNDIEGYVAVYPVSKCPHKFVALGPAVGFCQLCDADAIVTSGGAVEWK